MELGEDFWVPQMGKMLRAIQSSQTSNMAISIFVLKSGSGFYYCVALSKPDFLTRKMNIKTSALFTLQSYCDNQIIILS